MQRWLDFSDKADLLMYGSGYPHWSTSPPESIAEGLDERAARQGVVAQRK